MLGALHVRMCGLVDGPSVLWHKKRTPYSESSPRSMLFGSCVDVSDQTLLFCPTSNYIISCEDMPNPISESARKASSLMLRRDLESRRPLDCKSSGSLEKRFSTPSVFSSLAEEKQGLRGHTTQSTSFRPLPRCGPRLLHRGRCSNCSASAATAHPPGRCPRSCSS